MTTLSYIGNGLRSLRDRTGRVGLLITAAAVGVVLAVISRQAGILDFAGFTQFDTFFSNASSAVSISTIGIAFVIGAIMVVLPCGFPSVFLVPSILNSRPKLVQRAVLGLFFLGGSALVLSVAGVVLSFFGTGILELLSTGAARMRFAVSIFSLMGVVSLAYAANELGFLHLPAIQGRITGPNLPEQHRPYRRSLILGASFGGGLGIACPMPTYYLILGWVVAAANPLYGAVLMASYGLGRVAPALVIGAFLSAGADRRLVSRRLALVRERTAVPIALVLAALGAYILVLFGVFMGLRAF